MELKGSFQRIKYFLSDRFIIVNCKMRDLSLLFFSIILILGFFIEPIFNPDIGWHLSIGKYIVENLRIPYSDFLSWTFYGKEWLNTEWLTEIFYYIVFSFGEYKGLYLLKFVNILLISVAVYFYFLIIEVNRFNLLWFSPSLFFFAESIFTLRPDNYSVLFFILLVNFIESRKSKDLNKKDYLFLSVLFLLWVNMHGGYFYGLVLISIYLFSSALMENLGYIYNEDKKIRFNVTKRYFYILITALISSLINPHGYKIYSTILSHLQMIKKIELYICEWKNTDFLGSLSLKYGFVSTVCFLIAYLVKFIRKRKLNLDDIFLLLFFNLSGFLHVRLIIFSSIITHFVFVKYFKEELNSYLRYILVILFSGFYITFGLYDKFFNFYYLHAFKESENYYTNFFLSEGAVDFISQNFDFFKDKKVFNDWNLGGELGWRFYGKIKVFMDGRYIFLPLLEEQYLAFSSARSWDEFSTFYDIDYAVISNAPITKKKLKVRVDSTFIKRPLYLNFFDKRKWSLVYFDFRNIIIVNNKKFSRDFLDRYKYDCLLPYDEDFMFYEIEKGLKLSCYKKDLINYIRRELNNKNSFSYFYVDVLRVLKEYENERKRNSNKSGTKSRKTNINPFGQG